MTPIDPAHGSWLDDLIKTNVSEKIIMYISGNPDYLSLYLFSAHTPYISVQNKVGFPAPFESKFCR